MSPLQKVENCIQELLWQNTHAVLHQAFRTWNDWNGHESHFKTSRIQKSPQYPVHNLRPNAVTMKI